MKIDTADKDTHAPVALQDLMDYPQRFQMSYNSREVKKVVPAEYWLMDDLGCDRSGVHKVAIMHLYSSRRKAALEII